MLTGMPDKPPARIGEELPSDKEQQPMRNKDLSQEEDETNIKLDKLMCKSVTFKDEKESKSFEELANSKPQIECAQEVQSENKPDVCDTDWQVADLSSNDQSEVKPIAVTARQRETQQLLLDELQAHTEELQSAKTCQLEKNSLPIKLEEETEEVLQQAGEVQHDSEVTTPQGGTLSEVQQQDEILADEISLSKVSLQENNAQPEVGQDEKTEPEEQQCEEMPLDVIQHEETQLSVVQLQEVQTDVPQAKETQGDDNWVLKSEPDKLKEIKELKEPDTDMQPDVLQQDDTEAEQHKAIRPDDVWQNEIASNKELVVGDQQGETQILESQQKVVPPEEHERGNIQPAELEDTRPDMLQEADTQTEAEDLKRVGVVEMQEEEQQIQPEKYIQLMQTQPEELQEHKTQSATSQQEMKQEEKEQLEKLNLEADDIHHADMHLEEAELEETQSDEICQQDAHTEEPEDTQIDKWQQEQVGSSEKKLVLTHTDHLLQEDESQELKQDVVQKEPIQAEAEDTEEPQEETTQQDGVKQNDIQPESGKTQKDNMLQEQDLVHVPTEELELAMGETQPDETHQKEEWSEYLDQGQMELAMEESKQEVIQLEDLGKQLDEQHHERDVQQLLLEEFNIKETHTEVQSVKSSSEDRLQQDVLQEAEVKLDVEETKLGELEVPAEAEEEDKQIVDEHDILQLKNKEQKDTDQKVLLSEEQEK